MAKANGFQNFTDSAAEFLAVVVKRVKKMDKRLLLMIVAAVVLVIVIFALIVNGVKSSPQEDEELSAGSVQNIQELSTEEEPEEELPNGSGMYKVDTGSDADLNMRLAAKRDSDVVKRIPNGTELEVLFIDDSEVESADDFGWGYVEYNGERGWVFMEYLTKK